MKIMAIYNNNTYKQQNQKQQNFGARINFEELSGFNKVSKEIGCNSQKIIDDFKGEFVANMIKNLLGPKGSDPEIKFIGLKGEEYGIDALCSRTGEIISHKFKIPLNSKRNEDEKFNFAVNLIYRAIEDAVKKCVD